MGGAVSGGWRGAVEPDRPGVIGHDSHRLARGGAAARGPGPGRAGGGCGEAGENARGRGPASNAQTPRPGLDACAWTRYNDAPTAAAAAIDLSGPVSSVGRAPDF